MPGKNGAPPPPPEASFINALAGDAIANGQPAGAIDFDDDASIAAHARANAQAALDQARSKTKLFDTTYQNEQQNSKENYLIDEEEEELNGGDGQTSKHDPSLAKVNCEFRLSFATSFESQRLMIGFLLII